ncbi:FecR family protein [Pedobacter sp. SYSU D00535]|uniref:FecR family protein n=1 Tax=Pedobacter sp. SYSU D00535 TaxID=2810308 RepID=UPI001A976FCE|nr:FecR domain-containing protein [Pedobacter sp. SYSU D00535]
MDSKRLSLLLQKQKLGIASQEEIKELEEWYNKLDYPLDHTFTDEATAKDMLRDLRAQLNQDKEQFVPIKPIKPFPFKYIYRIAASVALICTLSVTWYFSSQRKSPEKTTLTARSKPNTFLTLPDGSTVILKPGSKIRYLTSFTAKSREVELVGEGYFDIKRDVSRPFVIHTGNIRTRVLGTAFNINAEPGRKDIIVTVTRGKVQVEDKSKVLAVLLAGKQVTYNKNTSGVLKEAVDAEKKTLWAKQDMQFEEVRFGDIASYLAGRYGKNIRFARAELAECPITASFSGEESLQEVLDILCMTRGASYVEKEGYLEISGDGCKAERQK